MVDILWGISFGRGIEPAESRLLIEHPRPKTWPNQTRNNGIKEVFRKFNWHITRCKLLCKMATGILYCTSREFIGLY